MEQTNLIQRPSLRKPSILLAEVTIEEAVVAPPIWGMLKTDKDTTIVTAVAIVSLGLNPFGTKVKMTGSDIALWVNDFLEMYYTDSFEDLAMMFKYARQGKLAKDYHYVDGLLLFQWYKEYLNKKLDEREKIIEQKKLNPVELNLPPLSDAARATIGEIVKDLKEPSKEIVFPSESDRRMRQLESHIAMVRAYPENYSQDQIELIIKDCRSNALAGDAVYLEDKLK